MDAWALIAERKIREAMDEGAFDDLASAGQPLELGDSPFADPADWMAHRVLKNNGLVPPWVEEAKSIDAEAARLRTPGGLPTAEVRERVAALNRRIHLFNATAPVMSLYRRPLEPGGK